MKIRHIPDPKVSVLIINHNNCKFIKKCVDSIYKQSYKNYEIIFFDDNSTDGSLKFLKKFRKKNFFVISNKKNTKFGSYNQINGYHQALKKSRGVIIFFLDSDDYFHPSKIRIIVDIYKNEFKREIIMDMPIYKYSKKIIKKKLRNKLLNNYWPYFSPQSCISMSREFANKVFKDIKFKKFSDIWLDFRISVYAHYLCLSKIYILNKYLTYYRQSSSQVSSNFFFLGSNWWRRRYQAHHYIKFFFKLKKIPFVRNADYLITKFINFFL